MTKLEELIKELCPNGVEYKTVGNVSHVERGTRITKKDLIDDGQYVVISGGTSPMGRYNKYNRNPNTITVSSYGQAGYVDLVTTYFWANDVCLCIFPQNMIINKYLYYCLKNKQEYLYSKTTKAIPDHLPTDVLIELSIPVPPIPVQEEIVRILDSFTKLTAELTAELTARKKQYEYYRDDLLKCNTTIPMVKLKDIATDIYRGAGIKREEVTESGIPCVRYGEIYTTYNTWFDTCKSHTDLKYVPNPKYFEHGDILFAITGESVDDIAKSVAYVGHEKCLAGGDIVVMKHKQNPRYLAHVLATQAAREQKSKGKVKSKVVHSNVPSIEQIEIPLPSLDVQERYANVLDNFESLCNDLKIGLPAEIEARRKQYEYYRDLLLSFASDGSQSVNVERERERERVCRN